MSTPALLPLRLLAVVAIVARSLVVDVLNILAAVSAANVAARRASGVYDLVPALTVESICTAALNIIGAGRTAEEAAVALAREAFLGCVALREVSREHVHSAVYQHVLEAVEAVEIAARTAPAGAAAADVAVGRWTGPRYQSDREAAAIASDLRRDLAAAAQTRGALRGVRCVVRKTGHMSLAIEVVAVPEHAIVLNPARVAAELVNPHEHTGLSSLSARGLAIDTAVSRLAHAYGCRRGSDLMLHVAIDFAAELRKAQRAEIEAAVRRAGAA